MDEAQVKAILSEILDAKLTAFKSELTAHVDTSIATVRAEIPAQPESRTENTSETESPALLATQKELQELKQRLADQEVAESNSRLENLVLNYASQRGVAAPQLLVDVVHRRYRPQLIEDNKKWFFKDGASVASVEAKLDDFLRTKEGKALLLPTGNNGSGSAETTSKASSGAEADPWAELARLYTETPA